MENFLPSTYEKPAGNSSYLKLINGDNKFRILSPAITGWLDWENKKPVRSKEQPEQSIDPAKPVKHFWAFIVWDYTESKVKILEITQKTIQDSIYNLHSDENWGSPLGYDLNVKREGEALETKYSVVPTPPAELNNQIKETYKETNINLEALFSGDDPFNSQRKEAEETFGEPNSVPYGNID